MNAKNGKGGEISIGDVAIVGGALAAAWMLKDSLGGIGKGIGDLGSGLGKGLGDLGSGLGGGIRDVTSIVPAVEQGFGSWGSNIGHAIDFGDPANWLNKIFQTTGQEFNQFGHFIDLTDSSKYDWVAGSNGILANTGNFLGDVGSSIDVTDPNSAIRNNPVTDFIGWINPWG